MAEANKQSGEDEKPAKQKQGAKPKPAEKQAADKQAPEKLTPEEQAAKSNQELVSIAQSRHKLLDQIEDQLKIVLVPKAESPVEPPAEPSAEPSSTPESEWRDWINQGQEQTSAEPEPKPHQIVDRSLAYSAAHWDELVAEGLALDAIIRPEGANGAPDLNFEGGRLEGSDGEWSAVLDRIREAKQVTIAGNELTIKAEFSLEDIPAGVEAQPFEYLNERLQELIRQGYVKETSGRESRPDGMFASKELMPTSEAVRDKLEQFRSDAETLVQESVVLGIDEDLAADPDHKGEALGRAIREAVKHGTIDVKDGKVVGVDDPQAEVLSSIYTAEFQAALEDLTEAQKAEVDVYLDDAKKEILAWAKEGKLYRDDMYSGKDAKAVHDIRQKLAKIGNAYEDALFTDSAMPGNYTANIEATQRRDMADLSSPMNAAHAEALQSADRETLRESKLWDKYQGQLDTLRQAQERSSDAGVRQQLNVQIAALTEERNTAVNEEAVKQKAISEAAAITARKALSNAGDKSLDAVSTRFTDVDLADKAIATRAALGTGAAPFLKVNRGGLLHFKKNRGPKVVEAYYNVPGSDNLVVVERTNRRTGELLSQSAVSTKRPIRQRGGVRLPSRELDRKMGTIRQADTKALTDKAKADKKA